MDRRAVWAIILMMVIAILPAIFLRRPPARPPGAAPADSSAVPRPAPEAAAPKPAPLPAAQAADTARPARDTAQPAAAAETVHVVSPLYAYGVSTRGARLVSAELARYRSMAPNERGEPAELLRPGSDLLATTLVLERDTIRLDDWTFTPSTDSLPVQGGPARLGLTAQRGHIGVELTYTFVPDSYRVYVRGHVSGVGPNGGLLLVGMGPGLANTEADSNENHRALAIVTKQNDAKRTDFSSLEPGEPKTLSGPFDWVAIKSKYFTTAVLAFDSTGGRITGVTAVAPPDAGKRPSSAAIHASLPVTASGDFSYSVYAGPLEHDRLRAIGHDFDDVNPYGWPGFRTLIRFFAVPTRALLVWMHDHLGIAYGFGLIIFGILVRVLLWPLNQKAMRASMAMQAIQPLVKEIQDRYKEDPQRMQQEMFRLYKEHNVNPFGGCWPMLLPMPVLFALFFVFQNTIELRGTSFLWLPDLSRPDPYYIIPLIMGVSMFALSKVGQLGMEPNPQMKMMLYVMPAMMTFLFLNFASGLNLYYAVSNIASVPQQYLLARERMRRNVAAPAPAPPPAQAEVRTKPQRQRRRR
ncbi:MAG TPA: membrane protein insertase YidC [Gemmatimonadales bacterium]|nr:membrane protein insertase YidC [Gemmatimonadales bacterium]